MQIEEAPTAPRSPFQNPHAERDIGSNCSYGMTIGLMSVYVFLPATIV
jgi:hypothetical protein